VRPSETESVAHLQAVAVAVAQPMQTQRGEPPALLVLAVLSTSQNLYEVVMYYVKIENGVVIDRAIFDEPMPSDWPDYDSWVQDDEAQIGWSYDGTTFTAPPALEIESLPPSPEMMLSFDHENRLRTLEGQPLLTFDDFLTTKLAP
jgi:hypothetical protein